MAGRCRCCRCCALNGRSSKYWCRFCWCRVLCFFPPGRRMSSGCSAGRFGFATLVTGFSRCFVDSSTIVVVVGGVVSFRVHSVVLIPLWRLLLVVVVVCVVSWLLLFSLLSVLVVVAATLRFCCVARLLRDDDCVGLVATIVGLGGSLVGFVVDVVSRWLRSLRLGLINDPCTRCRRT